MNNKPTYIELKKTLQDAENIIDALRCHKVDAVVGSDDVALIRLKKVEDQLREQMQISRNRLEEIESIYQNVPVGLCILDRDLKFVRVNKHLAKINGIPAKDHLGKKISDLLPIMAGDIEKELYWVIENGKSQMNIELAGETPARPGVKRSWLQHWLPLFNDEEEVIGINMVIEEITERKEFEVKLQQLNSTLEERVNERTMIAEERADKLREMALEMTHVEEKERQRLARVLHDGLQQLLIGAKFNAQHIRNQISDQDEVNEQLKELNQILDQSIQASRSLSYELSPPILHDHGLLAALHWLADMRHMKGLHIDIHSDEDLPELSQNLKVFLFQVIREFLINIIKHAEVDKAEVKITNDEPNIRIEVIDKGAGFSTTDMENNNSSSQGLRNIREKLELMNGELKIVAEPGRGSHFILTIPVDENLSAPITQKTVQEESNQSYRKSRTLRDNNNGNLDKITVLVVDDHQVMRNGLVRLLARESDLQIIGEASNGIEAVKFVEDTQPDVIIMDITMPEMDGIEATRQIHQKYPDIQIVGLSMHEEGEYTTLMKAAGAMGLLNKGGPAEQLFEAVRGVGAK